MSEANCYNGCKHQRKTIVPTTGCKFYISVNNFKEKGPKNIAQVKPDAQEEFDLNTSELRSRAMNNLRNRTKCCLRSRGQHMKNFVFNK